MIPIIGTFTFSSECRSHCKYRSREKRSLCLLLRRSSCLPFVAAESSFVLHFAVVWLKPKNLLVSEGQLRYMQNFTSKVSIYIYYFTAPQEDKRVLLFLSKTRQNLTPADIILIFVSMRGIISRWVCACCTLHTSHGHKLKLSLSEVTVRASFTASRTVSGIFFPVFAADCNRWLEAPSPLYHPNGNAPVRSEPCCV